MGFFTDKYEAEARKKFESKNSGLSFDTFYSKHKQEYFDHKGSNAIWDYHYNNDRSSYGKKLDSDIDKWVKDNKGLNKPSVAESTIQAQSTQQANLRAQQTGTPDANNQVSESQKDTETKRRQNKAKGKRGFVVARESGQGINI